MSLCCEHCFDDEYLKDYIRKEGSLNTCNFCGKSGGHCIDPIELSNLFEPVVGLYTPVEDFMPLHDLKEGNGDFIWERLQDDWQIFAIGYEEQEKLLRDMFPSDTYKDPSPQFLNSCVEREDEYWGADIEHNEGMKKHWEEFREEILYKNRFFPRKTLDLKLIESLFPHFSEKISQNSTFYRARISHDGNLKPCSEIGKPSANKSKNGRANPIGIPYLYVASDIDTVIAEIRPSIGDKVTVGKFRVVSDFYVIDLRDPGIESPFMYGEDIDHVLVHLNFMRILGRELSKPVEPISSNIEYVPTQYLCEFIKNCDYNGLLYGSAMGGGYNIAIFDDMNMECIDTELYLIEKAIYSRI
jgi:hypothetical protein